jgi:hypothetical protein
VNQNPDGLGQVLLYPYYTTNGGNQTILSVVNTTKQAKAVKVRFLEGQNSQEVLDFNLYLSPFDVWVAAIADVEGTPTLFIPDNSCTVPYLYGDGPVGVQEFLTFAYENDGGSSDISRAREGHFEMIEMGTVGDEEEDSAFALTHATKDTFDSKGNPVYFRGVPHDCGQLVDAWTLSATSGPGYWLENGDTDMSAPSGGLFGGAAIVNATDGTMFSYDAAAINGFTNEILHGQPGDVQPSLNGGGNTTGFVFSDNGNLLVGSFDEDRSVDAVSYLFMHDTLMNEYNTEDAALANSEWVLNFPTKRFYVDEDTVSPLLGLVPIKGAINCGASSPDQDCTEEPTAGASLISDLECSLMISVVQ